MCGTRRVRKRGLRFCSFECAGQAKRKRGKCEWCGQEVRHARCRYCSVECRSAHALASHGPCKVCGKPACKRGHSYCSWACWLADCAARRAAWKCQVCGKPLTRHARKFCGKSCLLTARRKMALAAITTATER